MTDEHEPYLRPWSTLPEASLQILGALSPQAWPTCQVCALGLCSRHGPGDIQRAQLPTVIRIEAGKPVDTSRLPKR